MNDTNTPITPEVVTKTDVEVFGVISLIFGGVSLLLNITCCMAVVGIPLGVLAIVLGLVSLSNYKNNPTKYHGKGLATAGVVTGALGIIIFILMMFLGMVTAALNEPTKRQFKTIEKQIIP